MEAATRLQYRMRGEEAKQLSRKLNQHIAEERSVAIFQQQVDQLRSALPGMERISTSEVLATTLDFLHFARARSGGDLFTEYLNEGPASD